MYTCMCKENLIHIVYICLKHVPIWSAFKRMLTQCEIYTSIGERLLYIQWAITFKLSRCLQVSIIHETIVQWINSQQSIVRRAAASSIDTTWLQPEWDLAHTTATDNRIDARHLCSSHVILYICILYMYVYIYIYIYIYVAASHFKGYWKIGKSGLPPQPKRES